VRSFVSLKVLGLSAFLIHRAAAAEVDSPVLPELLSSVELPYPEGAEGHERVTLELSLNREGEVLDATVTSGREPFRTVALTTARTLRFTPALVRGEPRAAKIVFAVDFEPPAPPPEKVHPESRDPATSDDTSRPSSPPDPEPDAVAQLEAPGEEIAVVGARSAAKARVVSDAATELIVGAEGDPLRALGALPGSVPIFAASPFTGYRGSAPAKIGYDYDGIRLPYLYHLGQAAAVVHPWLVESASTYGPGPARLGQAVGGYFEAKAAKPSGRLRAEARVRATESSAGVEVPLPNNRGSVLLAGRYSYMEPLVGLVAPDFRLDYWDYQARAQLVLSERDSLELLLLGAGDLTQEKLPDGSREDAFHGSFHRARVSWTHAGARGAVSRISALYGHDRWDAVPAQERPHSGSVTLRGELQAPLSRVSSLEVGGEGTYRSQYDEEQTSGDDAAFEVLSFLRDDVDLAAWVEWIYGPSDDLTLSLGLRADAFTSQNSPVSSVFFEGSLAPRQSLSYRFHPSVALHQSFGLGSQRPSRSQRTPGPLYAREGGLERSLIGDAGLEFKLPLQLTLDVTGFAGAFFDLWDVETLDDLDGQPSGVVRGGGKVVGLETSLTRVFGRHLRGLASYTLSRAERSVGRV
jgi:hypothetical protein